MPNSILPMVIKDAAVDFVLVGPYDGEQKVLATSENPNLLLLGIARLPTHLANPETSGSSRSRWSGVPNLKSVAGLYENDSQATLYSITAEANLTDDPYSRAEPVTLAWIGRTPDADLDPIENYFSNCVVLLHKAIVGSNQEEHVRWELAPLLFMCASCTKTRREAYWETRPTETTSVSRARLYTVVALIASVLSCLLSIISLLVSVLAVLRRL